MKKCSILIFMIMISGIFSLMIISGKTSASDNSIYICNGRHFQPEETPESFCKASYITWQMALKYQTKYPDIVESAKRTYDYCLAQTYNETVNMYNAGGCTKANVIYRTDSQGKSCKEISGKGYYYSDCDGIQAKSHIKL